MPHLISATLYHIDGQQYYAVATPNNWPVAVCGYAGGSTDKQNKAEADFLASAGHMFELLELLSKTCGDAKQLSDIDFDTLMLITEKAKAQADRFKTLRFGV
jgi:hypothetical protein